MNNKIINEWNKIKDYKIFDSINEFAILFDTNPNGSCYKKYSNYPWSKENFFFGEYKELLDFYKTSTEIPFYLRDMIGKKYGQLELKSFNVKIKNNKRVYYANCICDCGKECEKEYSRIIEGHVTTCGEHKQKHKEDLLTNFKEIVEKHWDYEKNDDLPEFVNVKSDKEYWWKNETESFKLKPNELTKRKFGTSFHEQCIYFYLKQLFKNVKNRYRVKLNNVMTEADIFLEDYYIAIEYDGVFWHKTKFVDDIEKSKRFNLNSIALIRVREIGLSEIDLDLTKTIYCNTNDIDFHKVIKQIILTIPKLVDLSKEDLLKLSKFKLTKSQFEDDKIKILDQYRTNYVEDNITKTCLFKLWDDKKNKDIIPQKISIQDDVKVWFTCKYGFSRKISVKSISDKHKIKCGSQKNCKECKSLYCPLVLYCNRWYRITNPCIQTMKYYYYRAIKPNEVHDNKDKLTYYNEEIYQTYIDKHVDIEDDNFYNPHSLFMYYKDKEIPKNLIRIFRRSEISMDSFNSFNDFETFMELWNPYVTDIKFIDFDNLQLREKFLLFLLKYMQAHKYNIKLLKINQLDKKNIISQEMILGLTKVIKKIFTYKKNPEYLDLLQNYNQYIEKYYKNN